MTQYFRILSFNGFTEIAKSLLQAGGRINSQNALGSTALISAASFNQKEIVQLLIEHGADEEIQNFKGNTAIDKARMIESYEIVTLLQR